MKMKLSAFKPARLNSCRLSAFLSEGIALRVILLFTFAFIFIFHTYPLGLSDFWWHMNAGRWIWANGGLPIEDPFLYSSVSQMDVRATQILRGYPLFQLLVFGAYSLAGAYALVVIKGLLMTLFYALMWNHLRRNGLHALLALAIVGALPLLLFRFDDFRPQIFTFIFVLLELQLIEHVLSNERHGGVTTWPALLTLPLIMLLWANLHGGFIIGVAILLIYVLAEWIARRRGISALSDEAYRRLLTASLFSVGAAALNPAGFGALWSIFTVTSGPFSTVVDEFLGTIQYFEMYGRKHLGYLIVATAAIPGIALLSKWRQISLSHLLLLMAFLLAGILSFRFSLLMVAVVLVIASAYLSKELNLWLARLGGIPIIILWCASAFFLASSAINRTSFSKAPLEAVIYPTAAIDYLEQSKPQGNIFNLFEYGGYMGWKLYPKKIFIDQRNLSWDTFQEYVQCWRGDYSGVFRKYGIGVVLYTVSEGKPRKVSSLIAGLFNSTQWEVGFYDRRNIVFFYRELNKQLPFLDKQKVVNDIIQGLDSQVKGR